MDDGNINILSELVPEVDIDINNDDTGVQIYDINTFEQNRNRDIIQAVKTKLTLTNMI